MPSRPTRSAWHTYRGALRLLVGIGVGSGLVALGILNPLLVVIPLSVAVLWVAIEYFSARADLRETRRELQKVLRTPGVAPEIFSAAQLAADEDRRRRIRQSLRQWRDSDLERHREACAVFSKRLRGPESLLSLKGLGLTTLPDCLRELAALHHGARLHFEVSPRLVAATGKSHGGEAPANRPLTLCTVERRLAEWVSEGHGSQADAAFLRRQFLQSARHIDLTGLSLRSLPKVVLAYPNLISLTVSARFLHPSRSL